MGVVGGGKEGGWSGVEGGRERSEMSTNLASSNQDLYCSSVGKRLKLSARIRMSLKGG